MNAIGKFATGVGIVAAWLVAAALPAVAAELVMFERAGCVWCARWDRDVGAVYAQTPEGRMAPLRRVDVGAGRIDEPGLAAPVRYTPTFVLIDRGREIGRITGYIGDDAFWGLLGKMLADRRAGMLSTSPATTTE